MNSYDHEHVSEHKPSEGYRQEPNNGLQRQAGNTAIADLVRESISGPGRRLDDGVRQEMEGYFGQPLGDVRVHTGQTADRSAQAVHAHAYTTGRHIVFRDGAYDPSGSEGKRLLAHELAHVVQQRKGTVDGSPADGISVSDPASPLERQADDVADKVLGGASTNDALLNGLHLSSAKQGVAVQRQLDGQLMGRDLSMATRAARRFVDRFVREPIPHDIGGLGGILGEGEGRLHIPFLKWMSAYRRVVHAYMSGKGQAEVWKVVAEELEGAPSLISGRWREAPGARAGWRAAQYVWYRQLSGDERRLVQHAWHFNFPVCSDVLREISRLESYNRRALLLRSQDGNVYSRTSM